jgi:pSer/pThr/pTyr-binding forkhead associated (FHA) protein
MKCSECGHENRAGVLICEKCGGDIYDILVGEAATKELDRKTTRELKLNEPPSSRPVLLYIGNAIQPLSVNRLDNLVIGRVEAGDDSQSVDIDLSNFQALEMGVSRNHARLDARKDPAILLDLSSANGTFVNGQQLNPDEPRQLESGDEIRLGRLVTRIYYK